ncbi:hypothetical protein ACFFK0_21830 [Paenibacillus chartarius]|uniref:Uncharacterized protein n=1 Tax=Paenibacillus chartarius TaxID=747481 RepID=A0ABV6DQV8_9BACL
MSLDALRTFVESGRYCELDRNKKQLAILRDIIKGHQSKIGVKRMEWAEQGVVGIFEGYRIYDYDMAGLKTILADLGLLPLICQVEWSVLSEVEQELMKSWVVSQPISIRITVKKDQKRDKEALNNIFEERISKLELTQLVNEWKIKKMENDLLTDQWKRLRQNLQAQLPAPSSYRFDFGTVSCYTTDPLISCVNLYNQLGEEVVMKYGQVDLSLLPVYMAKGFFSKNDIKRYRKVTDMRLKYTLMQIHTEQRRREFYLEYLRRLSM